MVQGVLNGLVANVGKPVRLMEVCGSHSFAIAKAGIRNLLPPSVQLLSGPGCPVCVSGEDFIARAIRLVRSGVRVAVFIQMIKYCIKYFKLILEIIIFKNAFRNQT